MSATRYPAGGSAEGYLAHGIGPDFGGKTVRGRLGFASGKLIFQHGGGDTVWELAALTVRVGGHNNTQIFFENPAAGSSSVYTSDSAVLQDPSLAHLAHLRRKHSHPDKQDKSTHLLIFALVAVLVVIVGLVVVVVTQKNRAVRAIANRVPVEWEEKLGETTFKQIAAGGEVLHNSEWHPYVASITNRLLPALPNTGYQFKFHIMRDTNINAFAMPGGYVVILTGLLERAARPEQVAGVVAHEIAHVTLKHGIRNIIESAGLMIVVAAVFGDIQGLGGIVVEGSRYLMQQKFSRDFEREADEVGWEYLRKAEIDPRGMIEFFETLREMEQSGGMAMEGGLSLLSTHPATSERIERLRAKWEAEPSKASFKAIQTPGGVAK